jgi:hypothetical protein
MILRKYLKFIKFDELKIFIYDFLFVICYFFMINNVQLLDVSHNQSVWIASNTLEFFSESTMITLFWQKWLYKRFRNINIKTFISCWFASNTTQVSNFVCENINTIFIFLNRCLNSKIFNLSNHLFFIIECYLLFCFNVWKIILFNAC